MSDLSWPKRLLYGAGWALAALALLALLFAAFLAGSIYVDGFGSAKRLAEVSNTTLPGPDGEISAYVARPRVPGRRPAVIMVHEFWGLNPSIVGKAEKLSKEQGYVVVAPDVFRGSTTQYVPRAIYQVVSTPAAQINQDLDAVVKWTKAQPDVDPNRIAIVGFCFGGRTSLLYSLHNPTLQATTVFYGQPVTDAARLKALGGPVLGIFGEKDSSIPLADVDAFRSALRQAGVESTVTVYPGQPHAFVKDVAGIESDIDQARAWGEMVDFLRAPLGSREETRTPMSPQPADDFYGFDHAIALGIAHTGTGHPWQH